MDYQVCEADSAISLQEKVNRLIGEGWRPGGGVSVVQLQSGKWNYAQAMSRGVSRPEAPGAGRPAMLPPQRPAPLQEAAKVPPQGNPRRPGP